MGTHYEGSEEVRRALDVFIKFQRASNTLIGMLQRSLRDAGLTEPQFAVLEMLHHVGPQQQNVIAKKMLCSGANMTFVIDRLEQSGLVKRKVNIEDRRCTLVELTDAGRARIEVVFPNHAAAITDFMARLTADEQVELGRLCKKLGLGSTDSCPVIQETPEPKLQTETIEGTKK